MDFKHTADQIMSDVRKRLDKSKGEWPKLVESTGVPYHTLAKLSQGVIVYPRLNTIVPVVQALERYEATGSFARPKDVAVKPRKARAAVATGG
jgi:predicted transcriptional regulator